MKLFNYIKYIWFISLKRYYYHHIVEYRRAVDSNKTLKYRMSILKKNNIAIIPISKEQRQIIKKRFKGICSLHKLNLDWFNYYNTAFSLMHPEKQFDITAIIPASCYFSYIDPYLCQPIVAVDWGDKNLSDLLFPNFAKPRTIARFQNGLFMDEDYQVISKSQAYDKIINFGPVVIKPSTASGGGRGLFFFDSKKDDFSILDDCFNKNRNYIIQELINQHAKMNELYPGSINTIRMQTLIWNNKARVISCALRMGLGGSRVDNLSDGGGLYCGVNLKTGELTPRAYDYYDISKYYLRHPQGCEFSGFIIPSWDKCISLVKKYAPRFSRVAKMLAWDIAIREDGEPILVECNTAYCGCDMLQLGNGPIFGDILDDLLKEVAAAKRKTI